MCCVANFWEKLRETVSHAKKTETKEEASTFEIELYKQICEDFRQLNQVFWQAPIIIISITGGIGFAVINTKFALLRPYLLSLAGFCNFAWLIIIIRLRVGVMQALIVRKTEVEKNFTVSKSQIKSNRLVMYVFATLLAIVCCGCFYLAFNHKEVFAEAAKPAVKSLPTSSGQVRRKVRRQNRNRGAEVR